MLAAERHRSIIDRIEEKKSVKVSELSELFGVTEKTVREDLEKLEEKGLLTRIHGGAVIVEEGEDSILPLQFPNSKHLDEKRVIAELALTCIEPNDIIALDAGSTTLELAKLLPNLPITVLTNDLLIIRELVAKDQIRLVVPGGYRHNNLLIGNQAQDFVNRLNVHKLFLSTTGIHTEYGFTIFTEELAKIKELFIGNAKEVFCLADASKFDKGALITFASLQDVHTIITDDSLAQDVAMKYTEQGITILQATLLHDHKRKRKG